MSTTKAIIIDDDPEEAFYIIDALSRLSISSIVYNGSPELLPTKPVLGFRILFLDFNLGDTDGADTKTMMSKVYAVLKKVISQNSPYILFVWSKKTAQDERTEILDQLGKFLEENNISPVTNMIDLDKSEFLSKDYNEKADFINKKLTDVLSKSGIFYFFLLWENLIATAAASSIDRVMSSATKGTDWDNEISKIIFQLGKAYLGKNTDISNVPQVVKGSMHTLNGVLIDMIENGIRSTEGLDSVSVTEEDISPEISSKINSSLLLIDDISLDVLPGNLYEQKPEDTNFDKNYWQNVIKDTFKSLGEEKMQELFVSSQFYFLEVSPACDYAQQKQRTNRLLPMLCFPYKFAKQLKNNAEYSYTPNTYFFLKDGIVGFVFDLRRFKSIPCEELAGKESSLRIRTELLVVIQQKVSNHISRFGFTSL